MRAPVRLAPMLHSGSNNYGRPCRRLGVLFALLATCGLGLTSSNDVSAGNAQTKACPDSSSPAVDLEAEGRTLLRLDRDMQQAYSTKDLEKILSYWSDDARIVEDGESIYQGKAAIRALLISFLKTPGISISWTSDKPMFSPDGKLAYVAAVDTVKTTGPDGSVVVQTGRGVLIWRRYDDDKWRAVFDISNQSVTK
jgi:ketosteroid isomerase-like protein